MKDLQEKQGDFADEGNNWFEQARRFVTTLNEGSYVLRGRNLESQKEFPRNFIPPEAGFRTFLMKF
jgi:hypothetical protein